MTDPNGKIFVTGHRGLVGSAVLRRLHSKGIMRDRPYNVVTATHSEVDLTDPIATKLFFIEHRPKYIIHCAAWVGGIMAHTNASSQAIIKNAAIQNNVIGMAAEFGVEKLLFLGSACAYPKLAPVPIVESSLGTGPLEESNKGYALCKMMGHELCNAFRREKGCNFISAVPTNLYGLNDNYHPQHSHVIPGMIHKFHWAKMEKREVTLWGTGKCVREFLWADDMASACLTLMDKYDEAGIVNLGSDEYGTLKDLAVLVAEAVGYEGNINWDTSKPDGTPVRYMDNSKIRSLGWEPHTGLRVGLKLAYKDFLSRQ